MWSVLGGLSTWEFNVPTVILKEFWFEMKHIGPLQLGWKVGPLPLLFELMWPPTQSPSRASRTELDFKEFTEENRRGNQKNYLSYVIARAALNNESLSAPQFSWVVARSQSYPRSTLPDTHPQCGRSNI